jgi:hypothetical protein
MKEDTKEIMKKETPDLTKNSTDYDIALTLYNMFKDKYIWVPLDKKWYMFDGNIWRESPKACDLRNNINNELFDYITDLIKEYRDKWKEEDNDEVRFTYSKKITNLNKLSHKIHQNNSKNKIISECALLFLKSSSELLNNGVYEKGGGGIFRKATSKRHD